MNRNTVGLEMPSGLCPTAPKPGSCGFCSEERLGPKIARWVSSKASQRRVALLNKAFCYVNSLQASAVPSETASPERIQFGYFPL